MATDRKTPPARRRAPRGPSKAHVARVLDFLAEAYPHAECALIYQNPYELLVATILSAQCTDVRVNIVTPPLFARYPDPMAMAVADEGDVMEAIHSTGFFRNKAKNIVAACRMIALEHGGRVPDTLAALVRLPGVGRKTANVVLGNAFNVPGITVDTHLGRVSRRLRLTRNDDPVKVESDLMRIIPQPEWTIFSHRMIHHGRALCAARKPKCDRCPLAPHCPSA